MRLIKFYIIPIFFLRMMTTSIIAKEDLTSLSPHEMYSLLPSAFENKDWKGLLRTSNEILSRCPESSFVADALYYRGIAYFHLRDNELANKFFSRYLKNDISPKYFEETLSYKFSIAEKFRKGTRKHLFGWNKMPKWSNAKEDALHIYEEIIAILPYHDLAARAMFSKAQVEKDFEEYSTTIETLQQMIRRFPKHYMTPEAFLQIAKVYLKQCSPQRQDSDLLALADINIRKFIEAFPNEKRIDEARKMYQQMQEIYARGLYEVGRFFARTRKPGAAEIYYSKIIAQYPQTNAAKLSQKQLLQIKKK